MSLLFIDGFDVGDFALKWIATGPGDMHVSAVTPFGVGRSLLIDDTAYGSSIKRAVTPAAAIIVGVNARLDSSGTFTGTDAFDVIALYGDNGATEHLKVQVNALGVLTLKRGDGTTLGSSPAGTILAGGFYFLEVKATIDNAAGTCVVRVNERVLINFTGDTRNGGSSANIDVVGLHLVGFGNACPDTYLDDLYISNGLGGVNNDFLGISRAQTLLPTGAGTDTDLTPTGSGNNWDNVNDVPYSTVDYNSSTTAGDRDTYQLADLASSTAQVAGVQTVIIARSDDTSAQVKAALRSGGSLYYDPAVVLNGSPAAVSVVVRETDPATSSAWTLSGVDALEAGAEIA